MFDSREKLIDILNWRRKQCRNLRWLATGIRLVAWMAGAYILRNITGELFRTDGDHLAAIMDLAEAAVAVVPLHGLAALLDAASELLSDSTLTMARLRQREDQRQHQAVHTADVEKVA